MFSEESISSLRDSLAAGRPEAGPTDVQVLPTPRCNASCRFCPLQSAESLAGHAPRFSMYQSDLPGGLLDRLADDLYYLGGLRRLTITGGEPLLYSHFIPMVFQFGRSFPEAELMVVTNGIRLKNFGAFFAHAGLSSLHVSINAGSDITYREQNPEARPETFDEIVAGIETVIKERRRLKTGTPRVTLSVVLTRSSAADVESLYELGRRTGVDAVTFVPLMEIRTPNAAVNSGLRVSKEEFQRFLGDVARFSDLALGLGFYLGYAGADEDGGVIGSGGLYLRQPCYAGYTFAAIYPNGDVRPCCHCEPVMGNLTESSFIEIWNSPRYQEQRKKMLDIRTAGKDLAGCFCGECGYLYENREYRRLIADERGKSG